MTKPFTPMLARPVSVADLASYVRNSDYALERKFDGYRSPVEVTADKVTMLNRYGEPAGTSRPYALLAAFAGLRTMVAQIPSLGGRVVLDGEYLHREKRLVIFDAPLVGATIGYDTPYHARRHVLGQLFAVWSPDPVVSLVPSAQTTEEKAALAVQVVREEGEGWVAKPLTSTYRCGEKARSSWLKLKLAHDDIDCVVIERGAEGKDNLVLGLYGPDNTLVEVGTVTALAGDGARVEVGQVVAVKVMCVTTAGRLREPTSPRLRLDKKPTDCTIDQLAPLSKEDACR